MRASTCPKDVSGGELWAWAREPRDTSADIYLDVQMLQSLSVPETTSLS